MEIVVAKNAGFCFGVEKAVEEVYAQTASRDAICTYGEIIHNEAVVSDLKEKGVRVIEDAAQLMQGAGTCVVIRSHGVAKSVYDALSEKGCRIVDATCPFVRRIHETVKDATQRGETVIVFGSKDHPEVEGIVGWASGPVYVLSSAEEALSFEADTDTTITVVSQTTMDAHKFKETVEILKKKGYNINIVNTICHATSVRQEEAKRMAAEVDVMIVVGGAHSSNTRKLYEICAEHCPRTYLIQSAGDLKDILLDGAGRVGITAGASTPKNIIEEVQSYVRNGSVV
ncbi:MAG: 4-hydroxy-3-methylbut-2-enyl diphosphate reductase [Lachnospiraceae bacterium]|nr:4-hydroxy-3-methylbut-2-enyl diphosphate reductase [Lachnospiraceae bacterium]